MLNLRVGNGLHKWSALFCTFLHIEIWCKQSPPPPPPPNPKRQGGACPSPPFGGWGGVGGREGNYLATKISSEIESDTISLLGCIHICISIEKMGRRLRALRGLRGARPLLGPSVRPPSVPPVRPAVRPPSVPPVRPSDVDGIDRRWLVYIYIYM